MRLSHLFLITLVFLAACEDGPRGTEDTSQPGHMGDTPEAKHRDRDAIVPGTPTGLFPQSSAVSMGTYNYNIPIEVPPGRSGMEPSISLSYHSSSQQGITGYVGWDVSGLSRISLCRKTAIRDGKVDGINFDKQDNYCLDGIKLIELERRTNEDAWVVPSDLSKPSGSSVFRTYAPEDNSANLRVISFVPIVGEAFPRTWLVLYPNKLYRWYGESQGARMTAVKKSSGAKHTIAWLLSGEEKNHNKITYSYIEDSTECLSPCNPLFYPVGMHNAARYIDEITYTHWTGSPPNLFGGSPNLRKVKFIWADEQVTNHRRYWVNGIGVLYRRSLASIDVYGPLSSLIRTYKLGVFLSKRTRRSMLDTVTVCDKFDACLPETRFTYSNTDGVKFKNAYEYPLPFANNPKQEPSSLLVADLNNDGNDDILYIKDPADPTEENKSYLSTSSGTLDAFTFKSKSEITEEEPLIDSNGGFVINEKLSVLSRPKGEFINFLGDKVFDFDLDRTLEFMHATPTFGPAVWGTPIEFQFWEYDQVNKELSQDGTVLSVDEPGLIPANVHLDLDGDQKQEFILFKKQPSGSKDGYRLNIYSLKMASNGTNEWVEGFKGWQPWNTDTMSRFGGGFAHDINGDGRTDFVFYESTAGSYTSKYLYINDGGELKTKSLGFVLNDVYFMDVNGDNLPDAVKLKYGDSSPTTFTIRINTGDGFTDAVPAGPILKLESKHFAIHVADFNEDGRSDFLLLQMVAGQIKPSIWYSSGESFYRDLFSAEDEFVEPLLPYKFFVLSYGHPLAEPDVPQWVGKGYFRGINLLDANGDGLWELAAVSEGEDGDDSNFVIRMLTQTQSENSIFAEKLVKVVDGLGAIEKISYARLSDQHSPCENDDVNSLPTLRKCIYNSTVVKELEQIPAAITFSPTKKIQYSYAGAQIDMYGRGFLGFQTITERDPHSGYETVSHYDHTPHETIPGQGLYAYPLASRPKENEFRIETGEKRLYTETNTWVYKIDALGGGVYRVLTKKTDSERVMNKHSGDPSTRTTTTYSDHDTYGFPETIVTKIEGGSTLTREIKYYHNYGQALLGLPKNVKRQHDPKIGQPVTRETAYSFTPQGALDVLTVEPNSIDLDIYEEIDRNYYPGGLLRNIEQRNKTATENRKIAFHWTADGTFVKSSVNALGHTTTFQSLPEFGGLHKLIDPNGITLTRQYDSFGRLVKEIDPDGFYMEHAYLHYSVGVPYAVRSTSSTGDWAEVRYDSWLQPTRLKWKTPDGNEGAQDMEYDYYGNLKRQSLPYNTFGGGGSSGVNYLDFDYDDINVLSSITYPDATGESFDYTGFSEKILTDSMGRKTKTTLNLDGLAYSVETFNSDDQLVRKIKIDYGVFGQLRAINDGASGHVSVTRDVRGRTLTRYGLNAGWTQLKWSPFGELVKHSRVIDPDIYGQPLNNQYITKKFHYDSLGRLDAVGVDSAVTPLKHHKYVYDAPGAIGFLASTKRDNDGDGAFDVEIDYTYDSFGRETKNIYTVATEQFEIATGYDSHGRVDYIRYPEVDGAKMKVYYKYSGGFLKSVEDISGKTLWEALEYDVNQIKKIRKGDSIFGEYEYNPLNRRVKAIKTTVGASEMYSKGYQYYANGQTKMITDVVKNKTETMAYDARNRLTEWKRGDWTDPITRNFMYDDALAGVLQTVEDRTVGDKPLKTVTYEFGWKQPQAVQSQKTFLYPGDTKTLSATIDYQYDTLGREIKEMSGGTTIRATKSFNGFDLPDLMKVGADTYRFLYDAEGIRVAKEKIGTAEKTIYIGDFYEKKTNTAGDVKHILHLYTPEGRLGEMAYDLSDPGYRTLYVVKDIQGTTEMVLADNGDELQRFYYSPYGIRLDQAGNELSGATSQTNKLFTGHELDDGMDLYNMKARLFNPNKRRFTTTDPIFTSFDSYAYTHNDPVNRIDPDGRCDGQGNNCIPQPPLGEDPPGPVVHIQIGFGSDDGTPAKPKSGGSGVGFYGGGRPDEKTPVPAPNQTLNMGTSGQALHEAYKELTPDQQNLFGPDKPRADHNFYALDPTKAGNFGGFLRLDSGIDLRVFYWGNIDSTFTFDYLVPGDHGDGIANIMAVYFHRTVTRPIRWLTQDVPENPAMPLKGTRARDYQKYTASFDRTHRIRFNRTGNELKGDSGDRKIAKARKYLRGFLNNKTSLGRNPYIRVRWRNTTINSIPVTELVFTIPKGYRPTYPTNIF